MNANADSLVTRVLIAVAAFEVALGGLFAVLAVVTPVRVFVIPAGVLLVVAAGLGLVARRTAVSARRRRTLLAEGIPATATITAMAQQPIFRNGAPRVMLELSVTVPGHPAYPVTVTEWVPLIFLGRLTDGRSLAVRVDPADGQRLAIDWAAPTT